MQQSLVFPPHLKRVATLPCEMFSGDYNSEIIFKIGQYLTKLCVEHLGFTFFWPTLYLNESVVSV